jgi:hypothetical protein
MKPENEVERQEAMQAAKSKKTFQKVVAANDAFEFCRYVPSAPCAWRKPTATGGQILFAQRLFTPFLPPDARSDTCPAPPPCSPLTLPVYLPWHHRASCRTSSMSTVHGNAYISEKKHCLSPFPVAAGKMPADVDTVVGAQGESCDAVCAKKGWHCDGRFISSINNCDILTKHFP